MDAIKAKLIIRNTVALLAGFFAGSIVNMGIVVVGPILIPPPPGVDMSTMESLAETIHLMAPINMLAPFLAHALGTLVGTTVACIISTNRKLVAGLMAVFFLTGGIAASTMIPAPMWFIASDLLFAYIPMAWLGMNIANRLKPGSTQSIATEQ